MTRHLRRAAAAVRRAGDVLAVAVLTADTRPHGAQKTHDGAASASRANGGGDGVRASTAPTPDAPAPSWAPITVEVDPDAFTYFGRLTMRPRRLGR